ncbi:MAG TPA: Gldg family protein [Deltaproteobacteria bacterium]|nr:Gldg family protein [Deltaproteobacteria bacterium]
MRMKTTSRYVKFALYFLVVVLINIVGITLFTRFDLTENKVYSLSNVSREAVSTLSEPLTINVFFTRDLPAPYNTVERYLRDLLAEYSLYSNKYFNYRFFDVSPEDEGGSEESAENRKMAGDYGIYPVQIQAYEQDEVKFKKAYMGLVIIHGDMVERITTITSTDGLEYKLTTAIQKLNNKISALINLEESVQIKLYMSSSLKQVAPFMQLNELPSLPERIKRIVGDLNRTMYNKLTYSFADPATTLEMDELVQVYSLMQLKWPDLKNGEISAGSGIIGLVMEYKDTAEVLPVLNVFRVPLFGTQYKLAGPEELEEMISESLETLIGINEDMGYLADRGTLQRFAMPGGPSQNAVSTFNGLLSKTYTLKDVELVDTGVPEGLGCLVIAGPTEKFSDYELFQIDQALMRGTNLAIFLDAFKEIQSPQSNPYQQQPPQYVPLSTGLEKLLEHYGVRIKKSYVLDESSYKQRLPQQYGGGEQNIYYAPIIESANINHDLGYMKNIKGFITLKISPLELDEKRIEENNIRADLLFSSSDKAWEMRDNINFNPMFLKPPATDDEKGSLPLAYVLEGAFPSYFTGKPIPEKPAGETQGEEEDKTSEGTDLSQIKPGGEFIATSREAKIFLMASSEMLKDNLLDPEGASPNAMFVMNILDVLNDRQDIAQMRSKVLSFNPLDDASAGTKTFIKAFNVIGLPVIVIIFGLLMWLKRHMRRKHIELMFQRQR